MDGSRDPLLLREAGARPGPGSSAALPRRLSKCFPARPILGERLRRRCNRAVVCVTDGKTKGRARERAGSGYLRRAFMAAKFACLTCIGPAALGARVIGVSSSNLQRGA
ncbi:hypothetical protein BvRS1_56110 [Burkholderia vietnamiensis]|nr:hypothetical protein BvRS1_56110 [Burkholderia vietnamiensis]